MGKVFQYGRDANIALVTMGSFGPKSALVHTGYISQDKMDELLPEVQSAISVHISLILTEISAIRNWISAQPLSRLRISEIRNTGSVLPRVSAK